MSNATNSPALKDPVEATKQALEALPSSSRLTREDTETVYALAYQMASHGQFDQACRYFSFLTFYRPTEVKYIAGLALCYLMLNRYEEALGAYSFVAALDPLNPEYPLAIAECQLSLQRPDDALKNAELVLRYADENPSTASPRVRGRALAIKGLIAAQTGDLSAHKEVD